MKGLGNSMREQATEGAPLIPIFGKVAAMTCLAPGCGGKGAARSMENISPLTKRLYYRCSNPVCGHSWTATLEFTETISPSTFGPVDRTAPMLRLPNRPNRPAL